MSGFRRWSIASGSNDPPSPGAGADVTDLLYGLLTFMVVAAALEAVLDRLRPGWPPRRSLTVAASVLPGVLAAICLWLFADAAIGPAEKCGVDACGKAMGVAMMGLLSALAGLAVGVVVILWLRHWRRP
jgi:hypothetical protein